VKKFNELLEEIMSLGCDYCVCALWCDRNPDKTWKGRAIPKPKYIILDVFKAWKDSSGRNQIGKSEIKIKALEHKNTSYFIDYINGKKRYTKIGDFEKGKKYIDYFNIYFFNNYKDEFQPTKHKIYVEYWNSIVFQYPQYFHQNMDRLYLKDWSDEVKEKFGEYFTAKEFNI
jgi:hypothetical protein